jgi:hypothetical protein
MSVSLLVSNVQVTGSSVIYNANFSGIGGTLVIRSGNNVLVSGGAGGTVNQAQINSLSGFVTGISGYLQDQIATASAGVISINGLSGSLTLQSTGGISISQAGQVIYISGNNWATSGDLLAYSGWSNLTYATITTVNTVSGNLIQTGIQLGNTIAQSGQAAWTHGQNNAINLSGSLSATGATLIARDNAISGGLEVRIAQSGQASWISANGAANTLSGQLTATGQNLLNLILVNSGLAVSSGSILSYLTGVATGLDMCYYNYLNHTFTSIPRVEITMELDGTNTMYGLVVSGRSTTGFYVLYTDIITESGIFLNVLAKN